jgi:hypothetical protein
MPDREHNGSIVVVDSGGNPASVPPASATAVNANVNLSAAGNPGASPIALPPRYPNPTNATADCNANAGATNRGSFWMVQLYNPSNSTFQTDEPNLEPLCFDSLGAGYPKVPGSHTLMLPRGVSLLARRAYPEFIPTPVPTATPAPNYRPDTSFRCADTDGDHKIDQVTVTLALSSYDESGADRRGGEPNDQRVRLTQTISLPNIR